jgi:HTH domain
LCLLLREEATDPGCMIRLARSERQNRQVQTQERLAILARYGSEQAALDLTAIEQLFVLATAYLQDEQDPWGALAGWALPWHPVPEAVSTALTTACPLPTSIADARDEALAWEMRRQERSCLVQDNRAALPTACMARMKMVTDLWRRDMAARTLSDVMARLEYWSSQGGDDGTGYHILTRDLRSLSLMARPVADQISTKERLKILKQAHPDWSLARLGQELGISRQAVHKHMKG